MDEFKFDKRQKPSLNTPISVPVSPDVKRNLDLLKRNKITINGLSVNELTRQFFDNLIQQARSKSLL